MADVEHTIGLLLGNEDDWPRAYESLLRRLGVVTGADGRSHRARPVRVTIEPFRLRAEPRHDLVIDRLARWCHHPREWLKKIALMDDAYVLNSPFTFQSMDKHAACCAMMRLGLKVPETILVPSRNPLENAPGSCTATQYNRPFDLEATAAGIGYPLWMKPYDGGAWVGVSKIRNPAELHAAYDASGERLMHLQAAVEDYDVFARSLTIGPETMVMKFRPEQPMHARHEVDHHFLTAEAGDEVVTISRLVNAFFRWEFNSCESLVRGTDVHPIDYANACPDVSLTSLHYYFPWAMAALLRWTVFCVVTERRPRLDVDTAEYFAIAGTDRTYGEKLKAYRELADAYFEVDRYREFCEKSLGNIEEIVYEWVVAEEFRSLLRETVRARYPVHEHEKFLAHFGGLIDAWIRDQGR